MLIEEREPKRLGEVRRRWQTLFALLLAAALVTEIVPELSAQAFYRIGDGIAAMVAGEAQPVPEERIVPASSEAAASGAALETGRKVLIRRGGSELPATSREGETVSALLQRESVSVGPLELVRVDCAGESIVLDIGSDFTVYETATEAVACATVHTTDYTIPKGETRVVKEGKPGTREVTYEVVYADGQLVSRQAVIEGGTPAENRVEAVGTLVTEAQKGDTIKEVVTLEDGSGYLLMNSGDSLHFASSMNVRCTAYTWSKNRVSNITYTGTDVHVGVVAVDKNVIPLGTTMFITTASGDYTYGMGRAEDTGVSGNTVDLFMDSYRECIDFGVRKSVAYFLD